MNNSFEVTSFQKIMLESLKNGFGIDIEPANNLSGERLDEWIRKTEDETTIRLLSELREVRQKSEQALNWKS